jgi:glycosyltransferase involved in cell wall biosynthesis
MNVSIIIPCYNQAQYLPDAIESALEQTVPCEVIVVNDGSPDNTSEVAKRFPVKLIEKENGGLSSARNAGIKEAQGEWILTLDSDDIITSDIVEKCIERASGGYDIVGTFQHEFGDSDTKWANNNLTPGFEDFKKANQINCCSLYKKEIWEKIGGYDENMRLCYEDWDFWLRATKQGYKVGIVPEFLFYYRKHGKTMISNAREHHETVKQYMLKKL